MEEWLEPPTAADGEDEVVAWLVETVLRGGSAMIEDVSYGRARPLRQRAARQIEAAIGGTVRTAMVSPTTILLYCLGDRRQDRGQAAPGNARRHAQAMGQRRGSSARPAGLATPVVTDRPTIGKITNTESDGRYRAPRARQNAGYLEPRLVSLQLYLNEDIVPIADAWEFGRALEQITPGWA